MYKKVPPLKKIYRKTVYAITKTFLRPVDKVFNNTFEAKVKGKLLGLHSQKYRFIKNKIYFIHIPKCGGTTIYNILEKEFKNQLFNYNYPYNYSYNTHYPLRKKPIFSNCQTITVLRHPCYRVYSFFIDALRNKKNTHHQIATRGIRNFCEKTWEARNLYLRYLSGNLKNPGKIDFNETIKHLNKFNEVFIFDNLKQDFKNYLLKKKIKTQIQNKNKKKYNLPKLQDLKIIKSFNKYDLKIFKYILTLKNQNKLLQKYKILGLI